MNSRIVSRGSFASAIARSSGTQLGVSKLYGVVIANPSRGRIAAPWHEFRVPLKSTGKPKAKPYPCVRIGKEAALNAVLPRCGATGGIHIPLRVSQLDVERKFLDHLIVRRLRLFLPRGEIFDFFAQLL